jgi:rod shape-determining protein MreC
VAVNRRASQRVTLLMLVLASVTVLTLDYHGEASRAIGHVRHGVATVFAPIQRGVAAVLHPVGDVVSGMFHYGSLETQNAELRKEIGALSQRVVANDAASANSRELYHLDNLPFVENIPTVAAEVISQATSNFETTIEIDRGTSDGVGVGMPVVAQKGLIGKVISAASHSSMVLLINDRRASIGVRLPDGNVFEATGNGPGSDLGLQQISSSATPRKHMLAVTAGDLAYPADIPVGTVSAVRTSAGGMFSGASLRPIVNLRDLNLVTVMLWLTPA